MTSVMPLVQFAYAVKLSPVPFKSMQLRELVLGEFKTG